MRFLSLAVLLRSDQDLEAAGAVEDNGLPEGRLRIQSAIQQVSDQSAEL